MSDWPDGKIVYWKAGYNQSNFDYARAKQGREGSARQSWR